MYSAGDVYKHKGGFLVRTKAGRWCWARNLENCKQWANETSREFHFIRDGYTPSQENYVTNVLAPFWNRLTQTDERAILEKE